MVDYRVDNLVLKDKCLNALHDKDKEEEDGEVLDPAILDLLPEAWSVGVMEVKDTTLSSIFLKL